VGKAKSLRKRLQNYTKTPNLSDRIRQMTLTATKVQWQVLDSELLAIITEAELIGTYQPPFNILLKDDKSPLYLCLTKDTYPKLLQVRKGELELSKYKATFGPYPSAYQLRQVLKLIRPIFQWCDQPLSKKPCFYYHLDRCSGSCIGAISPADYQESLRQLQLFLRGKTADLTKQLKTQMTETSKNQNFETAALLRDRLSQLHHITTIGKLRPDPTLLSLQQNLVENRITYLRRLLVTHLGLPKNYPLDRIEGYDVSNLSGQQAAVAQVVFTSGQPDPSQYRLYNIKTIHQPNDFGMLREAILRRQNHPEWDIPNLIVIDGGKGQVRSVLTSLQWSIPVIGIAKNPDRLIFSHVEKVDLATKKSGKATSSRRSVARSTIDNIDQLTKLKITYTELRLQPDHPGMQLVAALRDEAHRFSRKQHFRLRNKKLVA